MHGGLRALPASRRGPNTDDALFDFRMEEHMVSEPDPSSAVASFRSFVGTGGDSCQRLDSKAPALLEICQRTS